MKLDAFVGDDLDVEAWIDQMIAENGYAQIAVHDRFSDLPGYAFTIGLEQSRQVPELLCMGFAPDVTAQLFALCIDGHDAGIHDLSRGNQDVTGLVDDHTLRFRRVAPAMVRRANAMRPQRFTDIAAMLQVLVPDNDGFFPGDAECDSTVAAYQDPEWLLADGRN